MIAIPLFKSIYARFMAIAIAGAFFISIGFWLMDRVPAPRGLMQGIGSAIRLDTEESAPRQFVAYDDKGTWLATFTFGSRTVVMNGQLRSFSDTNTTNAVVTTSDWIRVYPRGFDGKVDQAWLRHAASTLNVGDRHPDILALATQYLKGAPTVLGSDGRTIAGDASYGPLQSDGTRRKGADFYDYVSIPYAFDGQTVQPVRELSGSLDSPGFVRMVWGHRAGIPLGLEPTGDAIPRLAHHMLASAPGIIVKGDTGRRITDLSLLQTGDILFFDVSNSDGDKIDHVGMYLGIDSQGHRRFISSRMTADGPTFGDIGGPSIIDGDDRYARALRAVRRF